MDEPFSVLAFGSLSSIATGLTSVSQNREFVVSVASTLDVAHFYLDMHSIDCIVCGLPFDADAPSVLSSLRERSNAPIVLLTDCDDHADDIDHELYEAIHCFDADAGTTAAAENTETLGETIRRAVRAFRDRADEQRTDTADTGQVAPAPADDTAVPDDTDEGTGAGDADEGTGAGDDGEGTVEGGADGGEREGDGGAPVAPTSIGGPEGMSAELQRSNVELEQFAYVAAHDLREPLRMVSSYLQLLQRRYGGELDDDADEFIGYAVDGADRMRQMINDLLAYARVDRYEEEFAEVDAGDAVETALSHLEVAIEESDADVEVGELPVVVGDRRQLTRLFQNLVSNAIKYAGDDPPAVHIDCARREDGTTSYFEFTVADDGIGIAPDRHDEVFAIFQSGSDDSTGIGLAICKKVVTRHGGDIWVESAHGEGTTFHFTLPVPDDVEQAEIQDAAPGESVEAR